VSSRKLLHAFRNRRGRARYLPLFTRCIYVRRGFGGTPVHSGTLVVGRDWHRHFLGMVGSGA
jgi:hypothetical protein